MRTRWLPVLLYVGLIFALSSLRRPPPGPSLLHADKLVHLVEYAILGILLARAGEANPASWPLVIVRSILLGIAVAATDELYQSTVPGRNASFADAAADAAGVILGAGTWWRWRRDARRPAAPRRRRRG